MALSLDQIKKHKPLAKKTNLPQKAAVMPWHDGPKDQALLSNVNSATPSETLGETHSKTDAKTLGETHSKTDAKTLGETHSKTDAKTLGETHSKTDAKTLGETHSKTDAKTLGETHSKTDAKTLGETHSKTDAKTLGETHSKTDAKTLGETHSKTDAKTLGETHSKTDAKTLGETHSKTDAKTLGETHSKTDHVVTDYNFKDFKEYDLKFEKNSSRYKVLAFLAKSCGRNSADCTEKFKHHELCEKLNLENSNLKKILQRLTKKGFIYLDKDKDFVAGRNGWIRYRVHSDILVQFGHTIKS